MFAEPFALIYFIGQLVYLFAIQTPNRRRFRRSTILVERTRLLDAALDFSTFIGWHVLPWVFIFSDWLDFATYRRPDWAGWLGAVLLAVSLVLLWRAYADLGASWSPKIDIRQGQTLVTDGIYRLMRHPIYAGIWLWAFAQPLLLPNWIAGFGLLVLFIPLYALRVPREEQMMAAHFGEAYHSYAARTGRFWPRRS